MENKPGPEPGFYNGLSLALSITAILVVVFMALERAFAH
jgi:hypothetical protein